MLDTYITQPGKLVRITSVARAMLDEARSTPCDAAGCERFKRIHERVIAQLSDVISEELHKELLTLSVHFDDSSPTPSEVRVAQAELVGWLEGLMAGIVATTAIERSAEEQSAEADERLAGAVTPGLYL
jgi:hypothetical protein